MTNALINAYFYFSGCWFFHTTSIIHITEQIIKQFSERWFNRIILHRCPIGNSALDQFLVMLGTRIEHVFFYFKFKIFIKKFTELAVSPANNEIHIFEKSGATWRSIHVLKEHDLLITGLDWSDFFLFLSIFTTSNLGRQTQIVLSRVHMTRMRLFGLMTTHLLNGNPN